MSALGIDPVAEPSLRRWMPLALLAAATLIAVADTLILDRGHERLPFIFGVTAFTATWILVCHPSVRDIPSTYLVVRLVLTAVLVGLNPWYGIYAWYGYVEAPNYLPERLVYPATGAFALIASASYIGGYPTTPVLIVVWLLLSAGSFALVWYLSRAVIKSREQEIERAHMLEELTVTNKRLEETLVENRGLQSQLISQAREAGVLDERARLAGEIHDTLAQALTGIIRQLEVADRGGELAPGPRPHLAETRNRG